MTWVLQGEWKGGKEKDEKNKEIKGGEKKKKEKENENEKEGKKQNQKRKWKQE